MEDEATDTGTTAAETNGETIVEQEVGAVADFVTEWVLLISTWIQTNILILASVWQIAALAGTLTLGLLVRRSFKRFLDRLSSERALGPILQRLLRTVAAISLPVCWVIGLWIAGGIFQAIGLPISLMRLVSSLLVAFVVIRLAAAFIPSAYWSGVFAWVAWSVAALNAVGVLDPVIGWMQVTGFDIGGVNINLWAVVKGLMLTALLIWLASALTEAAVRRLEASQAMTAAMRLLAAKILRMILIFIAVIIGLTSVGVDLTVFAVFSGALGIGVGLGLQQTASNLFASFALLAEQSVEPGDVIEIETPQGPTYGVVTKMTTRYVSVRTRDNTETLVPNQVMIANPVTNWSFSDKSHRRKVAVGVSYDTDLDQAIALCVEAAAATERVLAHPEPACLLKGFGDSSVDLELRFWINDPENGVANVTSKVLLNIWRRFREHDIEIPFPQRDLHLRSTVPLPVSQG
ncbi:MAG: mechanosensitive ion channel domain-containing protein [Pseudomonadota bacterium]